MLKNLSIQGKLILILIVVLALTLSILVVTQGFQLRRDYSNRIDQTLMATEGLCDEILDTQRFFAYAILRTIGDIPQVQEVITGGGDPQYIVGILEAAHRRFNNEMDGMESYNNILIFDADLNKVAEAVPSHITNILSDTPYGGFMERAREGTNFMTPVGNVLHNNEEGFWYAVPLIINDEFAGILALAANVQSFAVFLSDTLDSGDTSDAWVIVSDSNGKVIYSNHPSYVRRNINDIGFDVENTPEEEVFNHVSAISGTDMIAYLDSDSGTRIRYLVFFDRDEVDNIAQEVIIEMLPIFILVIAALGLVALIINRAFKPFKSLIYNAEQVARGNIGINLNVAKNDEIGQVSAAFSEIVKSLNLLQHNFEQTVNAIKHGQLLYKMEDSRLEGVFAEIIDDVDKICGAYIECIDLITEPFMIIDENHNLTYANNIIKEYTKNNGRDVVGVHIDKFLNGQISDHPNTVKAFREKKAQPEATVRLQLNPNQSYDFKYNCIPFTFENKVICAILIFTNITSVKKLQRLTEKQNSYISSRTEKLTNTIINAFEKGNLHLHIEKSDFDEETKEIAIEQDSVENVVAHATGTIKGYVDEITATLREISLNNFDVHINRNYIGDFGSIKDSIEQIVISVSALINEINSASSEVALGAEQISQSTQGLITSFDKQSVAMIDLKEAVSAMAEKTRKTSEDAQFANTLSMEVKDVATNSSKNIEIMSAAMNDIQRSSEEIAKVVDVIESIAFQTNLLALNASVEAARAGEHGRGFAVVAEEVRNLAGRSAAAVKETDENLAKSLSSVASGVASTKQTTQDLLHIVEIASNVADAIANITKSSHEQADEISSIQGSMENLSIDVSNNSSAVQSTASVSEELAAQAAVLQDLIGKFKIKK